VQILVDGRQVDTLAGHVDLRRPLVKSTMWIQAPGAPAVSPAASPSTVTPAAPAATTGAEPVKR
jgi:hypothetical protein